VEGIPLVLKNLTSVWEKFFPVLTKSGFILLEKMLSMLLPF